MVRRLAREAVIFMLLGMVLTAVGSFIYMHHGEAKSIRAQRDSLKIQCDQLAREPIGTSVIERHGSHIPLVSSVECGLVFGVDGGTADYAALEKQFGGHASPLATVEEVPPGDVSPLELPSDYFTRVQDLTTKGIRIKNLKIDNLSNALAAAVVGLYGFAGGFGLWLFYRLVRFAVKG